MNGLRWILGIAAGVFAVGWVALSAWSNGFRGSFGASANPLWKGVLPVAVALLLLAGLIWPDRRLLLHAGALAATGLLALSLYLSRETMFVAGLGVLYAVGWLFLYYQAAWKQAG
jgi:hypothetical protein